MRNAENSVIAERYLKIRIRIAFRFGIHHLVVIPFGLFEIGYLVESYAETYRVGEFRFDLYSVERVELVEIQPYFQVVAEHSVDGSKHSYQFGERLVVEYHRNIPGIGNGIAVLVLHYGAVLVIEVFLPAGEIEVVENELEYRHDVHARTAVAVGVDCARSVGSPRRRVRRRNV